MSTSKTQIIILSGYAGSGKTVALRALEDIGFHCIDNLPCQMLEGFCEKIVLRDFTWQRIAISLDSRDSLLSAIFPIVFEKYKNAININLLFLSTTKEILIRRFKETRRSHPLLNPQNKNLNLENAIELDFQLLKCIQERAQIFLDTSFMSARYLRDHIQQTFCPQEIQRALILHLISFGFKYGLPSDLDLVFDARCFKNPHYEPHLRPLTGLQEEIQSYVLSDPFIEGFIHRLEDFISYTYPLYQQEGKTYLMVGVGCTGGKHRSVTIIEKIAQDLSTRMPNIKVEHRHFDRE